MTDREMLELAAKAAGYEIDEDCHRLDVRASSGAPTYWNPRDDDGEAFRLAVQLGISLHLFNNDIYAEAGAYSIPPIAEARNGDPALATRRAIVRAAAEIGKGMLIANRAKDAKQNIADLVLTSEMTREERRAAFLAAAEVGKQMMKENK